MASVDRWIVCPRPNPQAHLRLFCFPYAGSGASIFAPWAVTLPTSVELYAVQLPGRESRSAELPFTRIQPLVHSLGEALQPYLNAPFVFFGHSLGAVIAFELARQVRVGAGSSPAYLFVSGCRALHIPRARDPIHELPDPSFVEELRRLGGTPEAVFQNQELLQVLLPVLRADFAVVETYAYKAEEPLDCPIVAYGGLEDPEVGRQELKAWSTQTRSHFTLRMFPGNHFYLNTARQLLLQNLSRDLSAL